MTCNHVYTKIYDEKVMASFHKCKLCGAWGHSYIAMIRRSGEPRTIYWHPQDTLQKVAEYLYIESKKDDVQLEYLSQEAQPGEYNREIFDFRCAPPEETRAFFTQHGCTEE